LARAPLVLRAATAAALAAAAIAGRPSPAAAQVCAASIAPVHVATAPATIVDIRNAGDARLFLVEQDGRVQILDGGALRPGLFLDLGASVVSGGEEGLLSLAFHPSYPATPWLFVYYTNGEPAVGGIGDVVLARFSVSAADPNAVDPTSRRILLVVPHSQATNHNGGQLQFGPRDGYLYMSIGDGGGGCASVAPGCNPQRDDALLGKLLRIDVNFDAPPFYRIPPDNPFVGPAPPRDEIWAKGLRNPFRISFDRQTADLWIADVGEVSREEIDVQRAGSAGGQNYGWPIMEGTLCGTCDITACPAPAPACQDPPLTLPFHDYGRDVGSTIIGGYVYRGLLVPALHGCYVFGDNAAGNLWALASTFPPIRRTLDDGLGGLTTLGEDRNGELYFAVNTDLFRVLPAGVPIPALGGWRWGGLAVLMLALIVQGRRAGRPRRPRGS